MNEYSSSIKCAAASAFQNYYRGKHTEPFSIGIDEQFVKAVLLGISKVTKYLKEKYNNYEDAFKALKNPSFWEKWKIKRLLDSSFREFKIPKEKYQELYDILRGKKKEISKGEFDSLWYNR